MTTKYHKTGLLCDVRRFLDGFFLYFKLLFCYVIKRYGVMVIWNFTILHKNIKKTAGQRSEHIIWVLMFVCCCRWHL